jgi:hypothetical protein
MINPNATLHEAIATGEKQGPQPRAEQSKQGSSMGSKTQGTSSLATLFKDMSHAVYLWMD